MKPLYYFNPTAELAVANGCLSYQPPLNLQKFESDLACLPMAYSGADASVVVARDVPAELLDIWQSAGIAIPSFLTVAQLEERSGNLVLRLHPWANSPNLRRIFPAYNPFEKKGIPQLEVPEWEEHLRMLSCRESTLPVWNALAEHGWADVCDMPQYCNTMEGLDLALSRIAGRAVIKLNYTSSGRGLFFVDRFVAAADRARIAKAIARGCVVEPHRQKVADFSMHFVPRNGCAEYLGWTQMFNDDNGRYRGNAVTHSDILRADGLSTDMTDLLDGLSQFYTQHLAASPYMQMQHGPVGIDLLLYHNGDGALRIHPCVEINARHTMGYVSLSLRQYLHSNADAVFSVKHFPQGAELALREMIAAAPLIMQDGKVRSGCLPLTDFVGDAQFAAILVVQ